MLRKLLGLTALVGLGLGAPEACSGTDAGSLTPVDARPGAVEHVVSGAGSGGSSARPSLGTGVGSGERSGASLGDGTEPASVVRSGTNASSLQPHTPWAPPFEELLDGLDGAAQLLAAGRHAAVLRQLSGLSEGSRGSATWFRRRAIASRAHFQLRQFAQAIASLEPAVRHRRRCRYFACERLGYELALARMGWVESGRLGDKAADVQLRKAASELLAASAIKPNRNKAEMRVAYSRALAGIKGSSAKSTFWAAKRALRSLDRTIKDFPNHPEAAELELERARAQVRARQYTQAAQGLRRLAIAYTGDPVSELAWGELLSLAKSRRRIRARVWSHKEELARASAARRGRWVDESRQILDGLVANEKSPAHVRRNALLSRGYTAYKQRDYEQCAEDFGYLYKRTRAVKMRQQLSRCLDRAGRYDEAADLWLAQAEKRRANKRAKATGLWMATSLAFRGGEYERASELLARYEKPFRSHSIRRRWLHAWLPYRMGRRDEAINGFRKLERISQHRTMARYFRAKILIAGADENEREEGAKLLRAVIRKAPLSYYGVMARQRMLDAQLDAGPEPVLVPMKDEERFIGYGEARAIFSELTQDFGAFSRALPRANQLHAAGWLEESRRELRVAVDEYLNGMQRLKGHSSWTPRNEDIIVGLGWRSEWSYPTVKPSKKGRKVLRDRDRSDRLRKGLRQLSLALSEPHRYAKLTRNDAYPHGARWHVRAFREVIEREAKRRDLNAFDLWSLMYTESRFRRHVVSSVGARGALQIMPWTGRQLQQRLGQFDGRFNPDSLFDIETNAYLAGYYVAELWTKFQGQAPLVYASYNGGPNNVARWLKAKAKGKGPLGIDVFIEEIPFRETRRYTKRVMEVHAKYALMYAGGLPRWNNEIDTRVESNIDF